MYDIFSWHNSEVLQVTVSGDTVDLVMSAAAVGRTGANETLSGFIKPLTLRCRGAQLTGSDPADCIGAILQGELHAGGAVQRQLALPWRLQGTVRLSLSWRNGSHVLIEADSAECIPQADARFMASYAC